MLNLLPSCFLRCHQDLDLSGISTIKLSSEQLGTKRNVVTDRQPLKIQSNVT